jgi:general secretion pathway protein D
MDVRLRVKQATGNPKRWIWLVVGALAVFTVSRALSQPAAKSARRAKSAEAQPLPATDAAGEDLTFGAYVAPEGDLEAVARELRSAHEGVKGFRVAADIRTGKLLIMAPAAVHKQLAAKLKEANEPAAVTDPKTVAPRTQKSLTLKNTKPQDFEAALRGLAGRQLPVAVEREGQLATYTLTSRSGSHVVLSVDRQAGQVTFDGPGDLVGGWVRVAMALDASKDSKTERSHVVPLRDATPAARGAIQRALTIVGQQVNETTVDRTGHLVSMRLQPMDVGAAQGAGQPGQPGDAVQQPLAQPNGQPTDLPPDQEAAGGLIGPVQIEFLEGLDQIVIRGHPRDVERVIEIIRQIEEAAVITAPEIEILNLRHVTSEAMAGLITDLYNTVLSARYGTISVTSLVKPNALLLIGRREGINAVIDLVRRLDQPVPAETQFQVFPLRHTAANEAETTIREYLTGGAAVGAAAQQQQQAAGLGTRGVVIADFRTNSLIVRASPRDLEEIDLLIKKIDVPTSAAVNQLRVFELRNSLAQELAPVLQSAITGQGQQVGGQQQQQPGGQFQQFQQQQPQQVGQQRAGQQQQLRSTMLQFLTEDAQGRRTLRSGILTDVRITADPTANTLIVSAPPDSMELIAALIAQLDQRPTSAAQIKVFQIVRGDAQSLMTMLQQLFGLQQTGAAGQQQQPFFQFIAPEGEGSPLVSLRFSVDTRTNSIIASGSAGDLTVVEAILLRLDERDVRERRSVVYRLKNSPAPDVANTINQLLLSQRQIEQQSGLQVVSAFEQIEREVVVVAEVVTNSLIISATERYFKEITDLVEQIDARPPMVAIQVLIAEVTLNNTDEFGIELGLQDSILFDRSLLGDIELISTTTTNPNQTTTETQQVIRATNTPGFLFNNVTQDLGNSGASQALDRANVVGTQGLSNFAVGRINNELGFGGLVLSASSESVSFLLRALSESRRLDVLARPQVTTLENQVAFIQVGQSVPLVSGVTFNEFGQTNNVTPTDVGLILLVQPRVTPDNLVVMDIRAERSEVGPEAEGIPISVTLNGDVIRQPRINRTLAETTVHALNGQTLVLGGLITKTNSETHRRVPLLADIPVLGHLFRYDNVQKRRTELLIIMTPRVLRTKEDADMLKQVESARMSWCLADVIKLHGESGLRGRNAEWTDAETTVVYPDFAPEMLNSVIPGSAEEILTPPAGAGPTMAPPPPPPSGGTPRLAPPTSPPPVQPGSPALRIPTESPATDAPPILPSDSGARMPQPATPTVKGPLVPVPSQAALLPLPAPSHVDESLRDSTTRLGETRPRGQGVVQNASHADAIRGSYYGNPAQPPASGGVQQALYQPPQGNNRQALYELPVK